MKFNNKEFYEKLSIYASFGQNRIIIMATLQEGQANSYLPLQ
jgi:hypothetical protein